MKYTNQLKIPLALAVFLATDDYDYKAGVISVTSLLKSTRQLVLNKRLNPSDISIDVSTLVASRMGSAIHNAIEQAWQNPSEALEMLGYPAKVSENILVNPTFDQVQSNPNAIPVYMEQRSERELLGYIISGKYDFVAEGMVQDFKSTSVYTYLHQSNAEKYILQGSIYRWLNPAIITQDIMMIHYIFTDWSSSEAKRNKDYPQSRVLSQKFKLLSLEETEQYLKAKLSEFTKYKDVDEKTIPLCNEEDLWRKETVWKFYADASKTNGRSTRNFDNSTDAYMYMASKGSKGTVIEVKGQVVACRYCNAFDLCTQKDQYIASGELILN